MSDEGIQCDRSNESDVTEELADVNFAKWGATENGVKNGDDLLCDMEDADDTVDDECDFDITEEEPGQWWRMKTITQTLTRTQGQKQRLMAKKVPLLNVQGHK